MNGQIPLIAPPPKLTDKQARAWELVRRSGRDGVTADEIGAILHADRGKHSAYEVCEWCGSEGTQVLRSKTLAPLVIRRRVSGRYMCRNQADMLLEPWRGDAIPF